VSVTWDIQTPAGGAGAVAIVQLSARSAGELDAALKGLGLPALEVGRIARRTLLGVDDGLLARWSPTCAQFMPHGGPAVVRAIASALLRAGLRRGPAAPDAAAEYPEARTDVEARMLAALARCASPRAIDLLLDQPRRWGAIPPGEPGVTDPALDRLRNRLLRPPLVVALGPPNVGKSTLVNALAGRGVSITADEPGTTRDHVGVELDLGGLVVHYVDTPGLEEPGHARGDIQAEAQALALQAARGAALLLLCGDAGSPDPRRILARVECQAARLVVALRRDLGGPGWESDASLRGLHEPGSDGEGLVGLVGLMVESLVPAAAVDDPGPWRFWD
jgi:tRNA modification GTPase